MRFVVTLVSPSGDIVLPLQHNELVQAAIYHSLSPEFAAFLHDRGYTIDNRRFALFSFSRLLGTYRILRDEKKIRFTGPVRLVVSSPVPEFVRDMAQLLLKQGVRIGNQHLQVTGMEMHELHVEQDQILVQTLSPIVAYSTVLRPDGKKYTLYFEPGESEYRRIVEQNLLRKGRLLHGETAEFGTFAFEPVGRHKRHLVAYKGSVIKAFSGRFRLSGDRRLLQTALDVGLGSKNSMGFGLVEMVGDEPMNAWSS